jgi:hypothetical protein
MIDLFMIVLGAVVLGWGVLIVCLAVLIGLLRSIGELLIGGREKRCLHRPRE